MLKAERKLLVKLIALLAMIAAASILLTATLGSITDTARRNDTSRGEIIAAARFYIPR